MEVMTFFFGATPVTGAPNGGTSTTNGAYTLSVRPGIPCSGATCKVDDGKVSSVVCASNTVAGDDLELTLTVYDVEGNRWDGNVPLFPLDQLEPILYESAPPLTRSETTPGQYTLALAGGRTQNINVKDADGIISALPYVFSIKLDDQTQVDNVGAGCTLLPDATDVDMSAVFYNGASGPSTAFDPVLPDVPIDYIIIPRDTYGNYRTENGGENFLMGFDIDSITDTAVSCPEDTGAAESSEASTVWTQTLAPTWDNTIKGFTYQMKTTTAGTYSVSMALNGIVAQCGTRKNWVQTVCADSPDPTRSYFSVTSSDGSSISVNNDVLEYVAGTLMSFETTLQDVFGNPVIARPGCEADTADVRVDNEGATNVVGAPACTGGGVDCFVTQVDVEPACRELFKKDLCAYPQTIQKFPTSDGRTLFEVNVTEAREFLLVPSIFSGGQWQALALSDDSPYNLIWDSRGRTSRSL